MQLLDLLRWIADTFGSGHKQGQSEHRDGGAVTNIGEVPVHFVTLQKCEVEHAKEKEGWSLLISGEFLDKLIKTAANK